MNYLKFSITFNGNSKESWYKKKVSLVNAEWNVTDEKKFESRWWVWKGHEEYCHPQVNTRWRGKVWKRETSGTSKLSGMKRTWTGPMRTECVMHKKQEKYMNLSRSSAKIVWRLFSFKCFSLHVYDEARKSYTILEVVLFRVN